MTDDLTVFFTLLGYASVKAAHNLLVKSTPGVNFINILRAAFTSADSKSEINTLFFALPGST
jgi:hypothetical protein